MIGKYLKITLASAAVVSVLSSCGSRVQLMGSSSESDPALVAESGFTTELDRNNAEAPKDSDEITEDGAISTLGTSDLTAPSGYKPKGSCVIDGFQTVMQEPELPTGCEVTALTEVLNYCGFDVDKVTMADRFMPTDYEGIYTMDEAYIGDPKTYTGFGCSAPVICTTAKLYFRDIGEGSWFPFDLTGTDFTDLFYQIDEGRPVIVWATMNLWETTPEYVYTARSGEEMWFATYQHCLAIYGYDMDEGIVYAADPLVGNTTYSISQFEHIYDILGKQGVILVKRDISSHSGDSSVLQASGDDSYSYQDDEGYPGDEPEDEEYTDEYTEEYIDEQLPEEDEYYEDESSWEALPVMIGR